MRARKQSKYTVWPEKEVLHTNGLSDQTPRKESRVGGVDEERKGKSFGLGRQSQKIKPRPRQRFKG